MTSNNNLRSNCNSTCNDKSTSNSNSTLKLRSWKRRSYLNEKRMALMGFRWIPMIMIIMKTPQTLCCIPSAFLETNRLKRICFEDSVWSEKYSDTSNAMNHNKSKRCDYTAHQNIRTIRLTSFVLLSRFYSLWINESKHQWLKFERNYH